LLDLNIEALKELGINTFGKRYKIMQAINSLKEESVEVFFFCQLNITSTKSLGLLIDQAATHS
jgi:hypothetical protein